MSQTLGTITITTPTAPTGTSENVDVQLIVDGNLYSPATYALVAGTTVTVATLAVTADTLRVSVANVDNENHVLAVYNADGDLLGSAGLLVSSGALLYDFDLTTGDVSIFSTMITMMIVMMMMKMMMGIMKEA